ncbi:MAG: hypothetical protein JW981_03780 [Anaerolineae bacterium]|nr:hypothetical protein [Anaerolineae bacterium]
MTESLQPQSERKFGAAFKNFAIIFSFVVNVILVLVLLVLVIFPGLGFTIKANLVDPLVTDLDNAFMALAATTIETQVVVSDTIPVQFNLPLNQNTDVILTQAVPLQANATFFLPGGGGAINGTVSLNLPEGMKLPVSLSMDVPVDTTIPVVLNVPVEILLGKAGMQPAVDQLRAVLDPVKVILQAIPDSTGEILRPK